MGITSCLAQAFIVLKYQNEKELQDLQPLHFTDEKLETQRGYVTSLRRLQGPLVHLTWNAVLLASRLAFFSTKPPAQ